MSRRPVLLDLFCGVGGAAAGYFHAGFDVIGVDHKPQPRYPFTFHQVDVFDFLNDMLEGDRRSVDVIHASPPCQRFSTGAMWRGSAGDHPDLIGRTRQMLERVAVPYVIENVVRAPIRKDVMLCGSMFGLRVIRHRHFEIAAAVAMLTPPCNHSKLPIKRGHFVTVAGHGGHNARGNFKVSVWQEAMGIDWAETREELAEAVPPIYTEFIGNRLIDVVR